MEEGEKIMQRFAVLKLNSSTLVLRQGKKAYLLKFGGVMNIVGRFIQAISDPEVIAWLSDDLGMISIDRVNELIQTATPSNEVVLMSLPQLLSAAEGLKRQGLMRDETYQEVLNFKKRLDPEELNLLYDTAPSQKQRDMGDQAYQISKDDPFGREDAPQLKS